MRKAILLPAIFLTACSNYPASLPSIKPYKMDIQQGNVVTSKMMLQLRPGMSRAQVRFVMGTPLIMDSFHANRWDYLYRMQKGGKVIEQRRVILDFEGDQLKHVRGDVVAAASAPPSGASPASREPVMLKPANGAAPKEKSVLDKLKFWNGDEEKIPAQSGQPAAEEKLEALPPLMEPYTAKPEAVAPKQAKPEPMPVAKPKPAPAVEQKQEEKGWLDKLKFWNSDEPKVAPKPEAKPTPKAEVKSAAKPEVKPAPQAESKPEPRKVEPTAEPKPAPKPQADLPTEEDPSYFEKMLEKIGF